MHNSRTDNDISKISTDSSSAGQQQNESKKYENPLKNKKVVFILQKPWKNVKLKQLKRKKFSQKNKKVGF